MPNEDLARALDRIADLLEIDGADTFRVLSYRRSARSMRDANEEVSVLSRDGRLGDLPGVGKSTVQKVEQWLQTGKIDILTELEARFPAGLPELLEIPGMGPKKVAALHQALNVSDMASLKQAIADGKLESLPGFGAQSVKKIADGIEFLERQAGRTPYGVAWPAAQMLLERVRAIPGVTRAEVAGSLRRGAETIGDIDILCMADDGEAVVKRFVGMDVVRRVLASGNTKGSVAIDVDRHEVQVDLRVVPKESFGAAWQYFTGSKEHNVHLREMAVRKGWRLNEYGLFDHERALAGATEEEVYARFGLPWVPPEVREDRGEWDVDWSQTQLVTLADIRGDLHMHTTASDGRNSIEEMAQAAKAFGYVYIAICDHSKSSTIANGLSIERMKEHVKQIRAAAERLHGITVLVGTECDIHTDGSLDYPDEILAECDWVVASIHSAFGPGGKGKQTATERTIAAMKNPYVCAIGHPTGRLINRRAPMEIDMPQIVRAAVETHTLLEVNASWQRLDLCDLHVRMAIDAGAGLVINTDAHSTEGLGQMAYGVTTARRGGAARSHVANCLTLAALRKRIALKRAGSS